MSTIEDNIERRIAGHVRSERQGRGWSLAELSDRSGVSRAMLSKIERGEASPTATVLARIASAFDLTLSGLIVRAEGDGCRICRPAEQPVWRDPQTGYLRRHVSPAGNGSTELVHVELPAGARVAFPAGTYADTEHLVWVLSGRLDMEDGADVHMLNAGDCLRFGPPADRAYFAPGPMPAVYVVIVSRR